MITASKAVKILYRLYLCIVKDAQVEVLPLFRKASHNSLTYGFRFTRETEFSQIILKCKVIKIFTCQLIDNNNIILQA